MNDMSDIHIRTVRWAAFQMADPSLIEGLLIDTRGTGILPYYWKKSDLIAREAYRLLGWSSRRDFIKWVKEEHALRNMPNNTLRRSQRLAMKPPVNYKF